MPGAPLASLSVNRGGAKLNERAWVTGTGDMNGDGECDGDDGGGGDGGDDGGDDGGATTCAR